MNNEDDKVLGYGRSRGNSMKYAVVLTGPPGSGKSTACAALSDLHGQLKRTCITVNLDPAAESLPYVPTVDVRDLVHTSSLATEYALGPNGALICACRYVKENLDWLVAKLKPLMPSVSEGYTVLLDCPGQVELYTSDDTFHEILHSLESQLSLRMCVVHLVDAYYCSDPGTFLAVSLSSLGTMMRLELPHINVLSKADLLPQHGEMMPFPIEFFESGGGGDYEALVGSMPRRTPAEEKRAELARRMAQTLDDYALVEFALLAVQNRRSLLAVLARIDRVVSYAHGALESSIQYWRHDDDINV